MVDPEDQKAWRELKQKKSAEQIVTSKTFDRDKQLEEAWKFWEEEGWREFSQSGSESLDDTQRFSREKNQVDNSLRSRGESFLSRLKSVGQSGKDRIDAILQYVRNTPLRSESHRGQKQRQELEEKILKLSQELFQIDQESARYSQHLQGQAEHVLIQAREKSRPYTEHLQVVRTEILRISNQDIEMTKILDRGKKNRRSVQAVRSQVQQQSTNRYSQENQQSMGLWDRIKMPFEKYKARGVLKKNAKKMAILQENANILIDKRKNIMEPAFIQADELNQLVRENRQQAETEMANINLQVDLLRAAIEALQAREVQIRTEMNQSKRNQESTSSLRQSLASESDDQATRNFNTLAAEEPPNFEENFNTTATNIPSVLSSETNDQQSSGSSVNLSEDTRSMPAVEQSSQSGISEDHSQQTQSFQSVA